MRRSGFAALAGVFAAFFAGSVLADVAQVTGSAGYREKIALPEGAVLYVQLQDVSKIDVPAVVMASQRFAMTAVPQDFALSYDPALIDERFTYTLSATLLQGDDVLFRTVQAYPVLTRGAGTHADLMLVNAAAKTPVSAMRLVGQWEVFEVGGRLLALDNLSVVDFSQPGGMGLRGVCNSYMGRTEDNGSNLRFEGPMAGTLKACPPEQEKLDREIIGALEAGERYERDGDLLAFQNAAGVTVLRLKAIK